MLRKINDDKLIVITGAAGLIGSGVVRHLNDKGYFNLVLVDNIGETTKWKNLLGKRFVDLLSIEDFDLWLDGKEREIDSIIHLGACSDTMETDGDYMMENNYRFTINLASFAIANDIRFIYASSAATYGDGSKGFSDDIGFLQQYKPLNLYGFSKHLFDIWALEQGVLDKIVGLKYFNVFGPNEDHKGRMASMVYKMLPHALNEGVIKLFKTNDPEKYADGEQVRDFIYVKDAARMTCEFLENDIAGIFNIGSGQPTTWKHLAESVFKAIKKSPKIEFIDMPKELKGAYQNYTCADMSKYLKTHKLSSLGLEYTVESATLDYVQNYLMKGEQW